MKDKNLVVFDLDGTLADVSHRLHLIQEEPGFHRQTEAWRSFHEACVDDSPKWDVIKTLWAHLAAKHEIMIVSGRSNEVYYQTSCWLNANVLWGGKHDVQTGRLRIKMRPDMDTRSDADLKKAWLNDGTIDRDRILCVYEDRSSVVKMWREEGITCFQVAPGDF